MFDHWWVRTRTTRTRGIPPLLVLVRATADVLLLTVLVVYVGRRGTPFEVGLVTVAYYLALTVFAPVWGALADILGHRSTVLFVSCTLSTVAIVPFGIIGGVWPLILSIGIYTIFAAGYSPLVLAIASERSTAANRGGSVGLINSARAGGGTLGRVIGGGLVGLLTPVNVFIAIGGVSLIGTLAALLIEDSASEPARSVNLSALVSTIRSRLIPDFSGELLSRWGLRWLYLSVIVQGMAVTGVLSLMPVYLTQAVGTSEAVMGALLGISPALQTVLMYVMGRQSDELGRKSMIVAGTFGRGVVFPVIAASATAFAVLEVRILIVTIGFVVLAATFSSMFSGTIAFIGDVTPDARSGEFMGMLWTTLGIGGVAGPLLLGTVATVTGYEVSFLVGAALAVGATAIVAFRVERIPLDEMAL